jgi:ribosomal protein L37E
MELTCPECGGPVFVLGTLGNLTHLRCRNCGADFHEDAADCGFPEPDEEE